MLLMEYWPYWLYTCREEREEVSLRVSAWMDWSISYKSTKEQVHEADEGLREEHALPEIEGVSHLGQEGDKEQGTTVGVDHDIDGVELAGEADDLLLVLLRWWAHKGLDGFNLWWTWTSAVDVLDNFRAVQCCESTHLLDQRRLGDCRVVDRVVGGRVHNDDERDDVEPDGQVANPAQLLELADGGAENAHNGLQSLAWVCRAGGERRTGLTMMTMQTAKQMVFFEICAMMRALPSTTTATERNIWRDWATLTAWRARLP